MHIPVFVCDVAISAHRSILLVPVSNGLNLRSAFGLTLSQCYLSANGVLEHCVIRALDRLGSSQFSEVPALAF